MTAPIRGFQRRRCVAQSAFLCLLAGAALALTGCLGFGNYKAPIATVLVHATEPSSQHPLVVVLPGIRGDAESLRDHGIAEAVHRSWPQADVMLTSATFAYYVHRNIVDRLDADIVEPARAQGYKEIWLAGASVGGMGVLFYEYAHPGAMKGLILMAPWLGDSDIHDEIRKAGGVRSWNPGPKPDHVDDDNYQREMWRVIKHWSDDPATAQRVWVIVGSDDKLIKSVRMLADTLPPSHYIEIPGHHAWETFVAAAERVSKEINR
ncbi:MAG TPA: alpha/beta hydrolase-fold protein [Nevskiaceae bacterium]|nr:alpha/beta hydrolase-fold protein [Nevskiaceae bacterium]